MDPDKTLEELRKKADFIIRINAQEQPDVTLNSEDAAELADLFVALDEWLSKKGFLPKAWAR